MPIWFNSILREADLPLGEVRLLRHKDKRAEKGRTPYELWRDKREQFDLYQSVQSEENREKLKAKYWASFVVSPREETLFVGLYGARYTGVSEKDIPRPHREGVDKAGTCDVYDLKIENSLSEFIGKIVIKWGLGGRAWIQRADKQNKLVTELRAAFKEPEFPGFMNFMKPLSQIYSIPNTWIEVLQSAKGIYLLTCPKTKEQYVGQATGEKGLWGRWDVYVQTGGHGGDVALKSRDPSDYQVSILEVAGTASTQDDINKMEKRWKDKLQSREMGLNRN